MANGGAHSQSPRFFFGQARGTLHLMTARTDEARIPSKLNLSPGSGTFDRSDGSRGNLFFTNRTSVRGSARDASSPRHTGQGQSFQLEPDPCRPSSSLALVSRFRKCSS